MIAQVRIGWLPLALATALGFAAQGWADSASSTNFVLQRHAFTVGNPNSTNPVASTSYWMVATSLGGISFGATTNASLAHYPGYLVGWDLLRPDLRSIAVRSGRVWLEWAPVDDAISYTVESASRMTNFAAAAAGLTSNRWDAPLPVATSQFYRVKALQAP
jgi:hypothetical protein